MGLERHDRGGLRRLRPVAAVLETPLTAIAVQKICNRVLDRHGLKGVFNLVIGPQHVRRRDARSRPAHSADQFHGLIRKWDGMWPKWWPNGWAAPCWSWAATTASS